VETGLVVGLAAALAWGIASYLGAIGARQFGGWITNIGASVFSFIVLVPLAFIALPDRPAEPTLGDIALLGSVGIAILGVDFLLYTLLTMAPVAVIYPILASNSAVVTVLAVILLGEEVSPLQAAGIMSVTAGVFLIAWRRTPATRPAGAPTEEAFTGASLSATPRRSAAAAPTQASLSAIAAAIGISIVAGVLLFIIVDATKRLGWYQPIIIDRVFQGAVIGALLVAGFPPRAHLRGHAPRWWLLLVLMGVLNAVASSLYGFGNQFGSTALTATAASTFAAVPVVLGIVLLGERPQRHQAVGIAAAIAGIVALGA